MGLRAEESVKRRKRPQINYIPRYRWWHYKPIFHWLTWEIWEYIDRYNLPYCSLYDEGFDRLGCIVCPMLTIKKHQRNKQRWPGIYKAFEHAMRTHWNNRPIEKRLDDSFEQFLNHWYRGK